MVPFVMFTEEMYKANFILDRWLKRNDKPAEQEGVQTKSGRQEEPENIHKGFENEDDDAHFDDWHGVSREGDKSDEDDNRRDDNDDNDDNDGGVMMPIPDASF